MRELDLDALTEEYRAGRGEPSEPCIYGHYDCAYRLGGKCEAEQVARMVGKVKWDAPTGRWLDTESEE